MKIGNFPEVVDENSGRIVAGIMTAISVIGVFFINNVIVAHILIVYLIFGFIARFLFAAKYEPIAIFVQKFIVPKFQINRNSVAGAPKRFAQFVGFLFSVLGFVFLLVGNPLVAQVLLGVLGFCAFLEAAIGFCMGCWFFAILMKLGIIPQTVCEECSNISLRYKKNSE
jgi:hypothetical protein